MGVVVLFVGGGGLAGAAGRWLLGRLKRGASVHSGWCEGATAMLWGVLGWRMMYGHLPWWWLPVPMLLTWFAVVLTVTDLRHRRLPDALTLPAYPVAGALIATAGAVGGDWSVVAGAALGAVGLFGLYGIVYLLWRGALGAGDVKLSGSVGAVLGALGWPALVLATWLAAVLTLVLGLTGRWRGGIPHGPGLLAATCLVAVFPS